MTHEVVFAPEAYSDLLDVYETIARESGGDRALAYVERIQVGLSAACSFPKRGTRRDHIRPGLRVIGFEMRVAIAFHIGAEKVTIDRIL